MNAILPTRLTFEEFLRWSQEQERGRYELDGGRIVALQAENFFHVKTKNRAFNALSRAIERTELPFYAMPDGPTVRVAVDRAYEPDALVAPLPEPPGTSLEVSNPVIVVEVLSPTPGSQQRDLTTKVEGYSRVASILHYIVIDPAERQVLHYRRDGSWLTPPAAPSEGTLRFDPPGLEVRVEDLLLPPTSN